MESPYSILGIPKTASAGEIKAAYRKLARKLHPDVNKEPDAQKKFAQVQQAYEILSDETKRTRYDRTGSVNPTPEGFAHSSGGFSTDSDDIGDMFNSFFRGRPAGQPRQAPLDLNITAPLSLDLETVAQGGKIKTRTPAGEIVEVTIPPAISAGATLRVREKGNAGPGGQRGDLLLKIRVKPHDSLSRGTPSKPDDSSLDLTTRIDISIADATLGGEVTVDRLGQSLGLTIPPSTPSGRALRLKGRGLTNAAGNSGDLYVELRIVPPDAQTISDEDANTLRRICSAPADNAETPEAQSPPT